MMSMNTADTAPSHEPDQRPAFERRSHDGRDEYVFRLDRSTPFIAAIAFAIGVVVGFALD